jgi:5-methylcytosine-specific restriction endonuclease McrA
MNRSIDHVTPLSRGGSHTKDNVVASCKSCNYAKGVKLYWEWDGELAA